MDASIIIRTKNEERRLGEVLKMIFSQNTSCEYEVIVVDSGSTDDTLRIASRYGCRITLLPEDLFSYGFALNRGAREAKGEYLVFLSGHSSPANEEWLDSLLNPFSDPQVGGVVGRQVPIKGVNPFEEWHILRLFPHDLRGRRERYLFSCANGAIRGSLWKEQPFAEELPFAEDRLWAKECIARGYYLAYQPQATVYHSHPYDFCLASMSRRMRALGYARKRIYGKSCHLDSILWTGGAFFYAVIRDVFYCLGHNYLRYISRSPGYRYKQLKNLRRGAMEVSNQL